MKITLCAEEICKAISEYMTIRGLLAEGKDANCTLTAKLLNGKAVFEAVIELKEAA
ncbi:MAG TPA: hypothetical protein VJ652_15210 [Noviherbaspirillum sp.]|nr:hypothetical protein [Noviherbaspirillum sp.]